MNLSDLSIEGLTQLEDRLAADLEMVKRVKALLVEYQKMGARGAGVLGGRSPAGGLEFSATSAPGMPPAHPAPSISKKGDDQRLTEALGSMPPAGFILEDLTRATYSLDGCLSKEEVKRWVKSMVRRGKITVVETRAGRIGSVYAAVRPNPSGTEG